MRKVDSRETAARLDGIDSGGFTRVVRAKRGYEYIFQQIREAILSGRYKPGDRLPAEREMAQIFGVSRNGVREAIRGLESVGLIEIRIGVQGGAFVAPGDPSTVAQSVMDLASLGVLSPENLLEARILLTSGVIRLACERATEEDLQRIEREIVDTDEQVTEPGPRRNAQITRFYRLLAEATHNDVLVMLMESLALAVHVRVQRGAPAVDPNLGALWRKVVGYIREGNPHPAIEAISHHLRTLEDSMTRAERERGMISTARSDTRPSTSERSTGTSCGA